MDRKDEEELVNIAWGKIDEFISDWQKSPYKWDKEIDIQVDIASRIKLAYKSLDMDDMRASYKVNVSGFEKEQIYSRVCCEPLTYYDWTDGKRYSCQPDIVIFKRGIQGNSGDTLHN